MFLLVFCYTLHFVTPFCLCMLSVSTSLILFVLYRYVLIIHLFTKLIVAVLSVVFHTPIFFTVRNWQIYIIINTGGGSKR